MLKTLTQEIEAKYRLAYAHPGGKKLTYKSFSTSKNFGRICKKNFDQ